MPTKRLKQKTLVCFETEEFLENPRYPTEPKLKLGGPDSGLPPPYLVTTGQAGHIVVGIDIGTKFSRLATFEGGQFELLNNAPIPSVAGRMSTGELTIGLPPGDYTTSVIQNFRGLIGSDWYVEAENAFYSAEMFTELLVKRLITLASGAIGRPVSKAVLTVPASFTSHQRKLLKAAAEAAGIDVLQLLNEGTAAAFYHCYDNPEFEGELLVYNMGAGCFSVSVMEFHHGLLEVKSTVADDRLSGQAFIAQMMDWMIDCFNETSGYTLDKTPATAWRLIRAAEQAIADIHMAGKANIKVTNLDVVPDKAGTKVGSSKTHAYLMASITKKEFTNLIEPVLEKTFAVVDRVIAESNTDRNNIEQVLLVGDYQQLLLYLSKFYDRFPGTVITPCSTSTHPVYGAALQASLLNHNARDFVVWDVLTEPVWVDDQGALKKVISRGTPLPITGYHKCESPDSTVNMHVLQGPTENELTTLADLTVSNCPPTTAGETKVEIRFIASADGIIDYRAMHIGLDSMLPVRAIEGQLTATSGWSESKRSKKFDESRLNRLARIMNVPPLTAMNILRSKGYTVEDIKNGRAIEDMLKKLKDARLEKHA